MIGTTISHYKIIEKSRPDQRSGRGSSLRSPSGTGLGEVPKRPASALLRAVAVLSIPPKGGSRKLRCI